MGGDYWKGIILIMGKKEIRKQPSAMKAVDAIFLSLIVFFTNLSNFIWYYAYYQYKEFPITQVTILCIITILVLWFIFKEKFVTTFLNLWKKNIVIVLFIVLALISTYWSVNRSFTITHGLLAVFSTLLASYYGAKFSNKNLINFVAVVVGIFTFLSLLLIIFFPNVGIHTEEIYTGLWHGVFWHKIYLGATMALGFPAYLTILFSPKDTYALQSRIMAVICVITGLFLAVNADAATGLVLYAIQAAVFTITFCWVKWGHLLNKKIYYTIAGLFCLIFFTLAANLDAFLGLFKRSSSLTGRIPMWEVLFQKYITSRPILGYGFSAFWEQNGITKEVQSYVHWYYPVLAADNGFIDTLLGLGIIGVILLISILVISFFRSFKNAIHSRELAGFFPVFLLVHIIIVNMSLSYFLDNECFVWFLLILVTFMSTPAEKIKSI